MTTLSAEWEDFFTKCYPKATPDQRIHLHRAFILGAARLHGMMRDAGENGASELDVLKRLDEIAADVVGELEKIKHTVMKDTAWKN